jgi:catechol 2,3-dioxygenase-like lactoylglutathione lyase family enzyme
MSIQDSIQKATSEQARSVRANHLAVRVSNLERSARFYIDALGARWLTDPLPLDQSECHRLFAGPPGGGTARFAFIGFESYDQPAFELIEFVEPPVPIGPTNTWEDALMHYCFTVPDVEAALERIEAAGGQRFGDLKKMGDPGSELTQLYFRDPDGNLFQLLSLGTQEVVDRLRLRVQA